MTSVTTALPGEPAPIPVDAARWKSLVPLGMWPHGFASSGLVWRRDVFAVAERWRAGQIPATHLAVAALAWGYGIRGYGPYRTARILRHERAARHLDEALTGLRTTPEAAVEGYRAFLTTAKLPGLGPAFFTKILYFAGYRRGQGEVQPLILDSVVASRLPEEAGAARRYSWGWRAGTWRDYLVWAAEQAGRAEFAGEPDQVEMALFTGTWTA
ncbi:8-oxoguanine DNA glycosylase OGG fold protein [Amycolatopsis pithecellobii]|uniref:Uncharacterized protein n=1 Tax=Amycolatopsis pithecellobii TaxID=664692 RepID=A0A6N7YRC2_9PSEU|nr:hypothetical protein [Amycolatopsis pithecellobii]MTD54448.1 hypothetical protein [Amycolatopsis pithecellobii]